MSTELSEFERFMRQRADAARAYVSGDPTPLSQIVARVSSATFFGPRGGTVSGTDTVAATYARDAAIFASDGESSFEMLDIGASDGIAYWVGFQRATTHMRGHEEAVPFNLRVTEIFRREGDDWKLVHRHADPLISRPEDAKA